jgi:hypothetical protein
VARIAGREPAATNADPLAGPTDGQVDALGSAPGMAGGEGAGTVARAAGVKPTPPAYAPRLGTGHEWEGEMEQDELLPQNLFLVLPMFTFAVLMLAFPFTWVYVASGGSVLVVAMLHATFNIYKEISMKVSSPPMG